MKSLNDTTHKSTKLCELCQQQDALLDCRLCPSCSDAILRLLSIHEMEVTENPEESRRARDASHKGVWAYAFSPLA